MFCCNFVLEEREGEKKVYINVLGNQTVMPGDCLFCVTTLKQVYLCIPFLAFVFSVLSYGCYIFFTFKNVYNP